jgi:hypothetical protein
MEIKIMIEYLSIYRQTCKLTIGKLFEINFHKIYFLRFGRKLSKKERSDRCKERRESKIILELISNNFPMVSLQV